MQLYKKKTKRETKSINQDLLKHKSFVTTNIIQIIIKNTLVNYLRLYIISYDLLVNNNFTNIKGVNNIIIIM